MLLSNCFGKILVGFFLLSATVTAHTQKVDRVFFFGPGMSSSLTSNTKSVSACAGAKMIVHLGTGGWIAQFSGSAGRVYPQVPNATPYWTTRPTASLGYRLKNGKNRLSLWAGFAESRAKSGDFYPTAVGGVIIKIKGRWGVVTDVSRNSQSWGSTTTLGVRF